MSSIPMTAKIAAVAIVCGVAIGAVAAVSVPRTPIQAAATEGSDSDRPAPLAANDQAANWDNTAQMAPPVDDHADRQTAFEPPAIRDDDAGEVNLAAPDDAREDAAPPQDDRAAQAADAARDAADDARAAEAAPR
jgi:hypothetical protein